MSFIILPGIQIWILFQNLEKINNVKFREIWGLFFEELNLKKKSSLFYNLIYMLRRLLICLTAFLLGNYPCF
jgi:hypothetical protein